MSAAYILIVIFGSANGHSTVSMQEFNSLQACQFASSHIGTYMPRKMICVPKGETK